MFDWVLNMFQYPMHIVSFLNSFSAISRQNSQFVINGLNLHLRAPSHMKLRPGAEFSISKHVREKLVSHTNFNPGWKEYFFYFSSVPGENIFTLYITELIIRGQSKMKTQDTRIWDPGPRIQDSRPQEPRSWTCVFINFLIFVFKLLKVKKVSSHETYYSMHSETCVFIQLQKKKVEVEE